MNPTVHPARAALYVKKPQFVLVLTVARVIYAALREEVARFPLPVPTLGVLLAQITALDLAQQALPRSPHGAATAARNAARDLLWTSLRSLQSYVQTVADADVANSVAILTSAGFQVARIPARDKPVLAAILAGMPGVVKLVANARVLSGGLRTRTVYHWEYSLDGGHTWVAAPVTTSAHTIVRGLPVMTTVSFRVGVTLANVTQPWAQSVTIPVH